ncbi:SDR family oxidoreductase [Burkholderia gladioli]|nr:SDR family oxidoreductase [Burkholderia gladioli]
MHDQIEGVPGADRAAVGDQRRDAVLFFLSPWARAVTGQNLIVDGGLVKG